MFSMHSVSRNLLIATFQLSSAASLNLGRSQNGGIREWVKRDQSDVNQNEFLIHSSTQTCFVCIEPQFVREFLVFSKKPLHFCFTTVLVMFSRKNSSVSRINHSKIKLGIRNGLKPFPKQALIFTCMQ